jgi:hypothetical protein
MTYPTVNTVLIWLNWFPSKARSFFMPETYAAVRLDLSK